MSNVSRSLHRQGVWGSVMVKCGFIHRCNRPSAAACSPGGQWWQECSLLTGQHAEGPPEPPRAHRLTQGERESGPYNPVPWNWHCAVAEPPHTPRDPSPPGSNKTVMLGETIMGERLLKVITVFVFLTLSVTTLFWARDEESQDSLILFMIQFNVILKRFEIKLIADLF